jgi:hypothetical protein
MVNFTDEQALLEEFCQELQLWLVIKLKHLAP